ncbi:hypothetical protein EYF80_063424 [Liparis tanakae]|uniref:Uncharacterized protein n=1 Tax=Liparis tanakae TaxID=230148 RepID=A0A4Z2EC87_9TELE|nr:hypothetical protein EYF80_063424 [Liparis tanakae]
MHQSVSSHQSQVWSLSANQELTLASSQKSRVSQLSLQTRRSLGGFHSVTSTSRRHQEVPALRRRPGISSHKELLV